MGPSHGVSLLPFKKETVGVRFKIYPGFNAQRPTWKGNCRKCSQCYVSFLTSDLTDSFRSKRRGRSFWLQRSRSLKQILDSQLCATQLKGEGRERDKDFEKSAGQQVRLARHEVRSLSLLGFILIYFIFCFHSPFEEHVIEYRGGFLCFP